MVRRRPEQNEKVETESESCSVVSISLRPHRLYNPWNSLGQNTGMGSLSFLLGNLPNPGIKPRSPSLRADSLAAEPPGKPCECQEDQGNTNTHIRLNTQYIHHANTNIYF